MSEPNTIKK